MLFRSPATALSDAFLRLNRFVTPLGDLAAGKGGERTGLAENDGKYSARMVRGGADELRGRLRNIFFPDAVFTTLRTFAFDQRRYYSHFRGSEPQPVVYGWSDRPELPLGGAPARRAVGLWAIEADVTYAGPRLWLPKGTLALRLKNKSAVTAEIAEGRFMGTRPAQLVLEFSLPAGCPDLEPSEATFYLEFRGSAFRPTVRVAPPGASDDDAATGRWLPLAGGPTYRLAQPGKYYNPATRSIVFAVSVDSASATARATENAMLGLSSWQIRDCDLEVKGVSR